MGNWSVWICIANLCRDILCLKPTTAVTLGIYKMGIVLPGFFICSKVLVDGWYSIHFYDVAYHFTVIGYWIYMVTRVKDTLSKARTSQFNIKNLKYINISVCHMENSQVISGIDVGIIIKTKYINMDLSTQGIFNMLGVGLCVLSCKGYVHQGEGGAWTCDYTSPNSLTINSNRMIHRGYLKYTSSECSLLIRPTRWGSQKTALQLLQHLIWDDFKYQT